MVHCLNLTMEADSVEHPEDCTIIITAHLRGQRRVADMEGYRPPGAAATPVLVYLTGPILREMAYAEHPTRIMADGDFITTIRLYQGVAGSVGTVRRLDGRPNAPS